MHQQIIPMDQQYLILNWVHVLYPATLLILFLVTFIVHGVRNAPKDVDKVEVHAMRGPGGRPLPVRRKSANQVKEAESVKDMSPTAKLIFRGLQTAIIASYIVNAAAVVVQALAFRDREWWPGQSSVMYIVGSFFVWFMVFISLVDTKPSPTWVQLVLWLTALPLELLLLGLSLSIYAQPHHEPRVGDQQGGLLREGPTPWEILDVIVTLVRAGILLGLVMVFAGYTYAAWVPARRPLSDDDGDEDRPLLGENGIANGHGHTYNAVHGQKPEERPQHDAWAKPTEAPNVTWYSYIRGFVVLIPYLWPQKSLKLQALALTCIFIMLSQRVINVFTPILIGLITDSLAGTNTPDHKAQAPWFLIFLYVAFRWLQGGQGLLGAARSILWIPVEQYSYRAISAAAFEHVHGLSAEFHTGKRTGELISALNKGSAINSFLEMVTFNVGPMVFDLVVAVVYLTATFDVYLGLVVAITTFLYIYVTIRLAAWRVLLRRNYTNADREMEAVKNDSLHSWDTVKYFNAEAYEFNRYKESIKVMQGHEYWVSVTLSYMNTIQGALFMMALMIACFIEAFAVATGQQTVGKFSILISYMMQLQGPLNFFGTFYRAIQTNLINAERMLELFKEQPHVVDAPNAADLADCKGDMVFDNVTFGYDKRRPAIDKLSFHCAPGTTTALVGESGGGKTTVMRLIFRYYNPEAGSILVDGKSVQDITIDSLRRYIGVVPQDCNMFNETIMYNLRYANQDATDEEIYNACRAASIHDRILMFPDGYDTKVGERGVRLSGGERQRVAIARTILKNPKITLLDEATAALDTETEERIQQALKTLAVGRTMLIIAHRLSTIVDADQILVLSGGTVVERGTHAELMEMAGKYASMWRKQSRAARAAQEVEELRTRAKKALEAAEADSASVSEDEMEKSRVRRNKSQSSLRLPHHQHHHTTTTTTTTPTNSSGAVGNAAGGSSSQTIFRQHKRVNFSQSSLGIAWNTSDESDGDKDHKENRNGRPVSQGQGQGQGQLHGHSQGTDGAHDHGEKPPGHP